MYKNHKYVRSGLVTGTMWDMMMKYMQDNGINVKSTNWGNYDNVSLTNLTRILYKCNIIRRKCRGNRWF